MKKFLGFTAMSIIGAALITASLLTFSLDSSEAAAPEPEITLSQPDTDYLYLLRDYNGYLAVFNSKDPEPELILQVFTKNLPLYDQQILKDTGVTVQSYQELIARIEDFIS